MARDPSASAPQHRSFPLYYSNDDRRFLHIPDIRHMWLFQTPVTWCHLCVGHICSLLHWFQCSFHCAFIWKVLCAFVLFCGGFLSICLKELSNKARGAHDGLNIIRMVILSSGTLSLYIIGEKKNSDIHVISFLSFFFLFFLSFLFQVSFK